MKYIKWKYFKPTALYVGVVFALELIVYMLFFSRTTGKSLEHFERFFERNSVIFTGVVLLFLLAILMSRTSVREKVLNETKSKLTIKYLYLIPFGIILSVCGSMFSSLFYRWETTAIYSSHILIQIGALVVLAPLVEEILFRCLTYKVIKNDHSVTIAMVISTILFTIVHLSNPQQASFDVILGVFLVCVYEIYNDLKATILAHAITNLTSIICAAYGLNITIESKLVVSIVSVTSLLLSLYFLYVLNKGKEQESE